MIACALLAASASVAVLSCNNSGLGILAGIKSEVPIGNTGLPDDVNIGGLASDGIHYYAAAGTMYRREIVSAEWEKTETPTGLPLASQVVEYNGGVVAVFYAVEGGTAALYEPAADGTSWNEITINGTNMSEQTSQVVDTIVSTPTALFVTIREPNAELSAYTTYETSDLSAFTPLSLIKQTVAVTDAADFNGQTWLVAGNRLYSGGSGTYNAAANAPSAVSAYGGVFASALTSRLYATGADGTVHATQDGSTWTLLSTVTTGTEDTAVGLHDMAEIQVNSVTFVLIGSTNGYYEVWLPGTGTFADEFVPRIPGRTEYEVSTSDDTYLRSTLDTSVVRFLYVDTPVDTPSIFAGTAGNGLWQISQNVDAAPTWTQE